MRVLNVTQSYAPFFEFGGPPAKVRALAEGLARKGHSVTVLTADWGLDRRLELLKEGPAMAGPFGRRREVEGVTAIYLPNWAHYRAASWNPALGRYLSARIDGFDVVHIFGLYDLLGPRVASECRERGTPYVVEPIGMFVPLVRSILLKRAYHRLLGKKMLDGASAIIATAEQERAELLAGGIAENKIVLRRNGVEVPQNLPERGGFRNMLGIPSGAKLILFLGRLSQKKSPDLLLRAAAGELRREDGAVHLAFVGPDESGTRARLKQMAEALSVANRVHFVEALDGAPKWGAYRDADVFVLPSQNENFGNTAAEALAAGTPAIVTDRCGIAPLVAGVAGMVVRHDEKDLAGALTALLWNGELHSRLRRGCAISLTKLGWQQPVDEMEFLYRTLVGGDDIVRQ